MKTTKSILALILFFAGLCIQLNAATLTVTSSADNGAGTLRDQIAAAAPGDIIVFHASTVGIPILLTTGELLINKDLTIIGNGILNTIIDGNNVTRILKITAGTVSIQGLTFKDGMIISYLNGGGIENSSVGTINLYHCLFLSCWGGADGGGIYTENGIMNITGCIFDGNHAIFGGGGIKVNGGMVNIEACTFTHNTALSGAGIQKGNSGTVNIVNSTFAENTAEFKGGGFEGTITLINCTVVNNHAEYAGGGVRYAFNNPTISNCIFYNNTASENHPDLEAPFNSAGYNIIGDTTDITGHLASTDMIMNPLLDSLSDNGGFTKTIALFSNSPAIDAANPTTTGNDQRGVPVMNGRRDIGAFENDCPSFTATLAGPDSVCQFEDVTYTTESDMTNYAWTINGTPGVDYLFGQGGSSNDNFVEIKWASAGTHTISVSYTNPDYSYCSVTAGSITTYAASTTPPTVSGPTHVCINEVATYSITPEPGTTYNLDVTANQSDYLILSGGYVNDTSITVQWLTAGSRTVMLSYSIPGFACILNDYKHVEVSPDPVCEITGDEVFCSGGSTTLDAGLQYDYLWSTTETTQTITVTTPGTYSVTVYGFWGCAATSSITVTELPATTATLSGDDSTCANYQETYATEAGMTDYLWTIQGTANVNYQIMSGGGSGDNMVALKWKTAGNHTITVSYTHPAYPTCTVVPAGITIYSSNPNAPDIIGNDQPCVNETVTYYIHPPANVITYSLSVLAPQSDHIVISGGASGDSSITVKWLNDMPKSIQLTIIYLPGCAEFKTKYIMVQSPPESGITGEDEICSGSSTTLEASSFFGNYLWSTGETTRAISVNTPGTYSVTVTSGFGCSSSSSFTVTQKPPVTVSISGGLSFCSGNNTLLNAGLFDSYNWSTGATTQAISVNTAGNISVIVTNADGCTGTASVTTTVNPNPSFAISGNLSFCAGNSTTLNAGNFSSYNWSTGSTTQTISVNTAATFTVTVTNASGCTKSASVTTTVNPVPSCTISGSGTICAGASTQWCAPAGLLYNWSNSATTRCVTQSATGNYTVTTTDVKGCSSICNKQLTVGSPLSVDAGPNKFIYYGYTDSSCTTLQSTIGGGTPPLTRQWSTAGSSNLGSGSSLSVCGLTASKTYYLTVTDANGCNMKDSVRVCVFDVRCGNGNKKVTVCHGTGSVNNPFQTICITPADAKWHFLNHPGEKLGACGMSKTCGFSTLRESDEEMIEGIEEEMGLIAYPNPAQNEMYVSFHSEVDGKYLLRLVDITGQILLTEMKDVSAGENKYTVNLQNFAPGIYLVLMQSGESILQTRIVKE